METMLRPGASTLLGIVCVTPSHLLPKKNRALRAQLPSNILVPEFDSKIRKRLPFALDANSARKSYMLLKKLEKALNVNALAYQLTQKSLAGGKMDPITAAAVISGGATIIGGLMNRDSQNSANAQNMEINRQNAELQKEFAQNGLRWKVSDAKAAGIHPLAALGASTTSYAPAAIGVESNNAMGNAVAGMGQDISRAVAATQTANEREMAEMAKQSLHLDLQGKSLDNAIRASQLAKLNATQIGPPMPSAGTKPVPSPQNPARDAGNITSYAFMRTDDGGLSVVPSEAAKERTEDDFVQQLGWAARNQLVPAVSGLTPPSLKEHPLPKGQQWVWNPLKQAFYPSSGPSAVDVYNFRKGGPKKWKIFNDKY
ncbi:DNA pilot protein [Tortoise microvirus 92]|nr:DNA pilot protein [Tortoise microvirus 92]